ncbi:MAG: SlyX family protein [Halioglobus sp.]
MPGDSPEVEAQIAQLQSQLAFTEDAIASLDDALASQQQEMLIMRRQIELLQQRLAEQAAGHDSAGVSGDSAVEEDRPPHY